MSSGYRDRLETRHVLDLTVGAWHLSLHGEVSSRTSAQQVTAIVSTDPTSTAVTHL